MNRTVSFFNKKHGAYGSYSKGQYNKTRKHP